MSSAERVMLLQEEDGTEAGRLVDAGGTITADGLAESILATTMRDNDLNQVGAFDRLWDHEWTNGPLRLIRQDGQEREGDLDDDSAALLTALGHLDAERAGTR